MWSKTTVNLYTFIPKLQNQTFTHKHTIPLFFFLTKECLYLGSVKETEGSSLRSVDLILLSCDAFWNTERIHSSQCCLLSAFSVMSSREHMAYALDFLSNEL